MRVKKAGCCVINRAVEGDRAGVGPDDRAGIGQAPIEGLGARSGETQHAARADEAAGTDGQRAAGHRQRLRAGDAAQLQAADVRTHVDGHAVGAVVGDDGGVSGTGHRVGVPIGGGVPVATRRIGPGNHAGRRGERGD